MLRPCAILFAHAQTHPVLVVDVVVVVVGFPFDMMCAVAAAVEEKCKLLLI